MHDRGVNHRTLQLLFGRAAEAEQRGDVSYEFAVSMLEVRDKRVFLVTLSVDTFFSFFFFAFHIHIM